MKLTRWKLLRKLWIVRHLAFLGVMVAIPTLGTLLTLVAAGIPLMIAHLLGMLETAGTFAVILAGLFWFISAAGVGVGALRSMQRIQAARASGGEVGVGRDGIAWRRWFKTHFARWAHVESVEKDGEFVVVSFSGGGSQRYEAADAKGLANAAVQALEAYRSDEPADPIAKLRRGDGSLKDWAQSAKSLLDEGDYREAAPPSPDVLVRVAADPTAPAEQRLGSALALGRASAEHQAKVRIALEETADPELAEAFEQVLEGDGQITKIAKALR